MISGILPERNTGFQPAGSGKRLFPRACSFSLSVALSPQGRKNILIVDRFACISAIQVIKSVCTSNHSSTERRLTMAVLKINFLSKTLSMQTNVTICLPSFSFADLMKGRE